jgi:NADH:ubiquinone oxidoreductase subunit
MRNYYFLIKSFFFGTFKGCDDLGNKYYFLKKNTKKRWVIFKGIEDPTKIPPQWYNWIHNIEDNPISDDTFYDWQTKNHKPNMTGTVARFSPIKTNQHAKHKSGYSPWRPS